MSVSITTSSIADLGKIGWESTFALTRAGHNPKNKREFLNALNTRAISLINASYDVTELVITDKEYADVAALIAGEATLDVTDMLRVTTVDAGDLADNALAVAKSAPVAAGDLYELDGADSVAFHVADTVVVPVAVVDDQYASVAAWIAAEGIAVGSVIQIIGSTTEDLDGDILEAAKTSAVAANDLYEVDGADSVAYLGTQTVVSLAVVAEEYAGVSEWIAGEAISADDFVFIVNADVTDNALETAKGSPVLNGDLFKVSATSVTFQGNGASGVVVQANLDAAYALFTPEQSAARFVLPVFVA